MLGCVCSFFQKVPEEVPSKYVSTVVEVQLACRLLFVDLEGLNDGRATKTIIPKVAPRKLVSLTKHVRAAVAH